MGKRCQLPRKRGVSSRKSWGQNGTVANQCVFSDEARDGQGEGPLSYFKENDRLIPSIMNQIERRAT